jgi:hypothetical protein
LTVGWDWNTALTINDDGSAVALIRGERMCCVVWYGVVLYGVVWYGMVWCGILYHHLRHSLQGAWCGTRATTRTTLLGSLLASATDKVRSGPLVWRIRMYIAMAMVFITRLRMRSPRSTVCMRLYTQRMCQAISVTKKRA